MKVTFIYPKFDKFLESIPSLNNKLIDHYLGNFTTPPSLGIPILAALTPMSWDLELVDDNNGDVVDFDADTDLVAINCFTPQATRAFEIADGFRQRGKKVVMGGFFPSTAPNEALEHADAVNIGDGEPTWLAILNDVERGLLRRKYLGGTGFDLTDMPVPRRDIFYQKKGYDWNEDLIQVARGCIYNCAMCAIPTHQGHRIRLRPIENIVREVQSLKYDNVYLAEDILFFPNRRIEDWAKELFFALKPLNKKFFVSSTAALNSGDDFLDLAASAGVNSFYCTFNVDPKSIKALGGDVKARMELIDFVHKIEDKGMRFFASFGMGRDWDDERLGDSILDLCSRAGIRTAEFFLFTPYPGSAFFERLKRQNRIIHCEWKKYNGAHVVYKPLGIEPEKLYEMFENVWNEFFKSIKGSEVVEKLEPNQSEDHKRTREKRIGQVS